MTYLKKKQQYVLAINMCTALRTARFLPVAAIHERRSRNAHDLDPRPRALATAARELLALSAAACHAAIDMHACICSSRLAALTHTWRTRLHHSAPSLHPSSALASLLCMIRTTTSRMRLALPACASQVRQAAAASMFSQRRATLVQACRNCLERRATALH